MEPFNFNELLAQNLELAQMGVPSNVSTNIKARFTTPQQPPIQPVGGEDLDAEVNRLYMESLQKQRDQADALKNRLAAEISDPRNSSIAKLDLRPFAQAMRGYGSTTAAVPTEGPEDRTNMQLALEKMIGQAESGITDDQLAFMKSRLEAKNALERQKMDDMKFRMLLSKKDGTQDRFDRGELFKTSKDIADKVYKVGSAASSLQQNIDQIEKTTALEQIPVQQLRQVITKFGKVMGEVGAQTEGDRASYFDPTIIDKFNQYLTKAGGGGTISRNDPNVQAMIEQINNAKEAAADGLYRTKDLMEVTYNAPNSPYRQVFEPGGVGESGLKAIDKLRQGLTPAPAASSGSTQVGSSPANAAPVMSEADRKELEMLKAKAKGGQ